MGTVRIVRSSGSRVDARPPTPFVLRVFKAAASTFGRSPSEIRDWASFRDAMHTCSKGVTLETAEGNFSRRANPATVEERVFNKAVEVISRLNEHRVEYKVVGGVALVAQGIVRVTEDLDFFINPTRDNVERLKAALRAVWDDPCIDDISYDDLAGDYPAVAYGPPDDSLPLDILARMGERYDWDNIDAESKPLGDTYAMVATPRMLFRMKRNTVRPKDRMDAEMLMNLFQLEEEP